MSLNKRFTGDYKLESIDSGDTFIMSNGGGVTFDINAPVISAAVTVNGTQYRIETLGTTTWSTTGAPTVTAGDFLTNVEYIIVSNGTLSTDFTLIGADDSDPGTKFTATGVGTGTGTALKVQFTATGNGDGDGTVQAVTALVIDGDLTILGRATAIESINTEIVDNIIVLNSGELGPGVSAGTSGIEIDRGDNVAAGELSAGIRFSEALSGWEVNNGDNIWLAITTGGTGMLNLVEDTTPQLGGNLNVVSDPGGGAVAYAIVSDPAFDINLLPGAGGAIALTTTTTGDITLTAADNVGITASAGTLSLTSNTGATLSSTTSSVTVTSGTDITLTATANVILTATNGLVKVEQALTLKNMTAPVFEGGYNKLYSDTIGEGGTGLYFVYDTLITDELVSKKKAIAYSIIF